MPLTKIWEAKIDLLVHLKCIQLSNNIYIYIFFSKSVHKQHKSLQLRSPACKPDLSSTEMMMEVLMGKNQPLQSMTLANAS